MEKISVAIADDNQQVVEILGTILAEEENVELVGVAKDGITAVQMIHDTKPDLIFLDLIMPRLDGIGVLDAYGQQSV